jgi:hypothetical protein
MMKEKTQQKIYEAAWFFGGVLSIFLVFFFPPLLFTYFTR